jgi:hypothetical protein
VGCSIFRFSKVCWQIRLSAAAAPAVTAAAVLAVTATLTRALPVAQDEN